MASPLRLLLLFVASLAGVAHAAAPLGLVSALERLRDQKSYSWEVINADPGPVAQSVETRRGTVTTVQQNLSPNLKGSIDRNGDMLIQREWSDGLKLDTVIAADGAMITLTPEGWMTDREILSAIAEERTRGGGVNQRHRWLRRADRPEIRRPDQELLPFARAQQIEASGDTYVVRGYVRADGSLSSEPDEAQPSVSISMTMNVRGGVVRDYEVKLEATRQVTRARVPVPVSDQRIVIITYLPISRLDIPEEARTKLKSARAPASTFPRRDDSAK